MKSDLELINENLKIGISLGELLVKVLNAWNKACFCLLKLGSERHREAM